MIMSGMIRSIEDRGHSKKFALFIFQSAGHIVRRTDGLEGKVFKRRPRTGNHSRPAFISCTPKHIIFLSGHVCELNSSLAARGVDLLDF